MTFENLKNQLINSLYVDDIEGREPMRWRTHCVVCQTRQVHLHQRLRSRVAACSNSHCAPKSNLSERDQRELDRAEAEEQRRQATKKAIEEARARDAERSQAEAERVALLKGGYLAYWNHCMTQPNVKPISMDEWRRLGIAGREKVMELIREHPEVPLHITTKEYTSSRIERPWR